MVTKNLKENQTAEVEGKKTRGLESVEKKETSAQTEVANLQAKDPSGFNQTFHETDGTKHNVAVNVNGKPEAAQIEYKDGNKVLSFQGEDYYKSGKGEFTNKDGEKITFGGRNPDGTRTATYSAPESGTGDKSSTPTSPSEKPEKATTPVDTPQTPTTPQVGDGGKSGPGDVKGNEPKSTDVKTAPVETPKVPEPTAPKEIGKELSKEEKRELQREERQERREERREEKLERREEAKGGGDGGGSSGGEKLTIPEKGSDKGVDKGVEKPAEKAPEKSPLDRIDLKTPEGRKELYEALKQAKEIQEGKLTLPQVDPKNRDLVDALGKLESDRFNKLYGMLSSEFSGKGTGMSDAAYQFNLRTLLGLEKIANPEKPGTMPNLNPELLAGLNNLFKMYMNENQNAQRSTMLAEAFKFSTDYNKQMGLEKDGLTSRDVLVALNSMQKDMADLVAKGQLLNPLLTGKDQLGVKELTGTMLKMDQKDAAIELTAKARELQSLNPLTSPLTAEQQAMKLPESALKAAEIAAAKLPQTEGIGKVEGQLLTGKDALAQQMAAEASKNPQNQPGQLGQKDPQSATKEPTETTDKGIKKRLEDEEAARRLAEEMAIAAMAAGGARTIGLDTADATKDEGDEDKGQKDDKDARRQYQVKQGDTLEMIAEVQLKSKTAATLVYNMNSSSIPTKRIGDLYIITMKAGMNLVLPTPSEVKAFNGPFLRFQYKEFASAEEELAFWQKFLGGQEPGHGSLFDKFGFGQPGAAGAVGVSDQFAAQAFTAAQRQNIQAQLGAEKKEEAHQLVKTVRYGESIRKFAARTLFDESLWELIASKNNLPLISDGQGGQTVKLKSYQKLILPSAQEVKQHKQLSGVDSLNKGTQFEMVSRECPKCRRLVRQNESVCPPPCFYAFVEGATLEDNKKAEDANRAALENALGRRRRRSTGFVADATRANTEEVEQEVKPSAGDDVVNTVLKAAGLANAPAEAPIIPQMGLGTPVSAKDASRTNRGVQMKNFDENCRLVVTPKDREGRKFERKLEVLKDGNWVAAVIYEIGAQESFVTEFSLNGAPRKQKIDLPFEPAMELSENHLSESWQEYRQQFLGE